VGAAAIFGRGGKSLFLKWGFNRSEKKKEGERKEGERKEETKKDCS
jgi:hypothetical protein